MGQLLGVKGRAVENAPADIECRDFALAIIHTFNEFLRFGMRFDIDLFEGHMTYVQELLGAAASGAPRRGINSDG